ncbi:MAG: PAS domain S-box protein, partial [Chloroflexi bacterium]|nr:PAS domain S-box protein [Chloroflexota bacterium]
MNEQNLSFVISVWWLTAFLTLALALLVWQRRPAPGVRPFVLALLCLAAWSATHALVLGSSTLPAKLFWQRASYLFTVTAPVAWLAFVLRSVPGQRHLTRVQALLLTIGPAITLALVWTSGQHGLFWSNVRLATVGSVAVLEVTPGPWFWVHVIYSLSLGALGLGLLVQAYRKGTALYRQRMGNVLRGAAVLMAGLLAYTWLGAQGEAALLLSIPAMGVCLANGFFRSRLFDLLPVAREAVVAQATDGVLVLDCEGRVAYVNAAAQQLLGWKAEDALGRPAGEVFPPCEALLAPPCAAPLQQQVVYAQDETQLYLDVRLSPLRDTQGQPAGQLLVLRDVTPGKQAEEALRRRAEELAALQATVLDIAAARDLSALLQAVVERATILLHTAGGGLYLCDAERQEVRCLVSYRTRRDYAGVVLKYGEGAAGIVAQSGQPLIVNDYRTWPGRAPAYEQDQPFSVVLSVPMIWQERVIGVLHVLEEAQARQFTQADVELLSLFASHAAIAVENARLYAETRQRLRELELLYEAGTSVLGTLELGARLQLIMDAAVRAVPAAHKGWLHLWDEQRQKLLVRAVHGFSPQAQKQAAIRAGEGFIGWVFAHRQPTVVGDLRADPRTKSFSLPEIHQIKSAICVPLVVHEQAIGTITLHNIQSSHAFNEDSVHALSAFANQAAMAIENARLYQAREHELLERQRTEEALRQSEARYRAIVEDQTELISRFRPDGTLTFVNDACCHYLNQTREELLGRSIFQDIPAEDQQRVCDLLVSLSHDRPVGQIENRVIASDGSVRWMQWTDRAILDEQGQVVEFQSVGRDVTRRRQAEEELRQLKEFNESIVQNMAEGIVLQDEAGRVTFVNPAAAALLGREPAELVGLDWRTLVPPEQQHIVEAADQRRLRAEADRYELQVLRKDGSRVPVLVAGNPRFEQGRFSGTMIVLSDLSASKQAEAEIRRKAEDLALLNALNLANNRGDSLLQILELLSVEGRKVFQCQRVSTYLLSPDKQFLVLQGPPILPPEARHQVELAIGMNIPAELRIRLHPGSLHRDILYSRQATLVSDTTTIQRLATEFADTMGLDAPIPDICQMLGLGSVIYAPLVSAGEVIGLIGASRQEPFQRADLQRLEVIAEQVTAIIVRQQAESEWREAERRFRTLLDNVQLLAVGLDHEGRLAYANPYFLQLTGYTREEASGQDWFATFVPEGWRTEITNVYTQLMQRAEPPQYENPILTKSGEERLIAWNNTLLLDAAGEPVGTMSIGEDVTERRRAEQERARLEAQLRQSQKLEAVGSLAGGVAHEFNNLLTIILGNLEMARAQAEASALQQPLADAERTIQRAAALVKQLLAFSRRQFLQPRKLDLKEVANNFARLLRRVIGEHVELQVDLAPDVPPVWADPGAVEQVLMNLSVNARDAMPQGGVLRIAAIPAELDADFCASRSGLRPGAYVRLTVADNGVGMDAAALQHVFEPFFTTKEVGQGSGLGLSAVYGLVQQHDGWVDVASQLGQGTCFSIYWPVYRPRAEAPAPQEDKARAVQRGTETIL